MWQERIAEVRRGVEKARSGLDQFLHDERGSLRWKDAAKFIGRESIITGGMLIGAIAGATLGLTGTGALVGISPEQFLGSLPDSQSHYVEPLTLGLLTGELFGMIAGIELGYHVGIRVGLVTSSRG